MLTKRQNLLETIRGGNPDRYVKGYEAFGLVPSSPNSLLPVPKYMGPPTKDAWGVSRVWPEGVLSAFPMHDPEHLVCPDIEEWQEYVKAPGLDFPESAWEPIYAKAEKVDRNEQFLTAMVAPGLFEMVHYLCEIKNALIYFYESPDELHELIKYLADYELRLAEVVCERLHPDAIFHHDDWGTQISTFTSPEMFAEFFLEPYKAIYGYYHDHGVEVVMHHSDSYAATLVPYMIEMGIDIWQGVMTSNDIPTLIEKYGEQITFMGGIDSATVDYEGWTPEVVEERVREACQKFGKKYFIPCTTQGGPDSVFPGVYECTLEKIDLVSKEMFA